MKTTTNILLACAVIVLSGCAGSAGIHLQRPTFLSSPDSAADERAMPSGTESAGTDMSPAAVGGPDAPQPVVRAEPVQLQPETLPDRAAPEPVPEPRRETAATPQPEAPVYAVEQGTGELIALNFDNADIYEVINALSDFLGINFIIDSRVKGRVNIHTAGEIDKSRLLPIMETIFEMNNIALVEYDDFYKIVPIQEAKQQIVDFSIGRELARVPSYDRQMIQIVPLRFVSAGEVESLVKRFMGQGGDIFEYTRGNLLVIVERAAAIRKMLRLINLIDVDVFAHSEIRFFKVDNADVNDIVKELDEIFSSVGIEKTPEKGLGLKFVPIDRIGGLLAISSVPGMFERVEYWLEVLDTVDFEAAEQVFIYFVENGKAEEIADVLNKIYAETRSRQDTQRQQPARRGQPQQAAQEVAAQLEGEIKIVVDNPTNSILIRATPHDYEVIKRTMVMLDRIPRQVLIEVLIAEVSLSGDTRFGIEWSLLSDSASIGGYKGQDKVGVSYGMGGLGTDLTKNLPMGFTYRFDSSQLQAFLMAQASQNKLNILSSPHILATDNREARIEVGQEVPIVTSEYVPQDREVTTSTSRSIEYRSTGVILSVTPRINDRGLVAMDVTQEVSEAQPIVAGGIQSPVISNRKAQTSLVVQDGQTIVIGGLIKEQSGKTVSGVPFLSKIPLLGYLFSDTSSKEEKTELIILMTPHVVSNFEEVDMVTRDLHSKLLNIKRLIDKGGSYWDAYR